MATHKVNRESAESVYDVYTQNDSLKVLKKFSISETSNDPELIKDLILDELLLDGNAKQNLSTFCQTFTDAHTREIMDQCIVKNMIDKDEYPQTAEIESRCVHILADLWNSPASATTLGCSTTGSSEAAMLGGLALKWRWRKNVKLKENQQINQISLQVLYKYVGKNLLVILM